MSKRHDARPIPEFVQDGQVVEPPKRLYKFLKGEHAAKMCEWGSVRIGTLYEYRNDEKYSHGVVDRDEGKYQQKEIVSFATGDQLSAVALSQVNPGGPNTRYENCEFTQRVTERDMYIYCLSLSDSWAAEIHPDYTVCVQITNTTAFLHGLHLVLSKQKLVTGRFHMGPVLYEGREHVLRNDLGVLTGGIPASGAFLKPPSFANQKEFRATYQPSGKVEPAFGRHRDIAASCLRHSTRPS